jgi:glycosyltransferase involved in cell wall biosynthesis
MNHETLVSVVEEETVLSSKDKPNSDAVVEVQKDVVCIIPTMNEAAAIRKVIKGAKQFTNRVVVVDGHSDDGTVEVAKDAGADVIFQVGGKGKGVALCTSFEKVKGDLYVIIDGDATYDALEMESIVKPILNGEADMVIGSRLKGEMEDGSITQVNKVGNAVFNRLINWLYNGNISDSQSGFRALSRKAVDSLDLSSTGFEIETEMTVKALKKGLKIKEVPITYVKRIATKTKLSSIKDGSKIFKTIITSL